MARDKAAEVEAKIKKYGFIDVSSALSGLPGWRIKDAVEWLGAKTGCEEGGHRKAWWWPSVWVAPGRVFLGVKGATLAAQLQSHIASQAGYDIAAFRTDCSLASLSPVYKSKEFVALQPSFVFTHSPAVETGKSYVMINPNDAGDNLCFWLKARDYRVLNGSQLGGDSGTRVIIFNNNYQKFDFKMRWNLI